MKDCKIIEITLAEKDGLLGVLSRSPEIAHSLLADHHKYRPKTHISSINQQSIADQHGYHLANIARTL